MQMAETRMLSPVMPAAAAAVPPPDASPAEGMQEAGAATPFAQLLGLGSAETPETAGGEQVSGIALLQLGLAFLQARSALSGEQEAKEAPAAAADLPSVAADAPEADSHGTAAALLTFGATALMTEQFLPSSPGTPSPARHGAERTALVAGPEGSVQQPLLPVPSAPAGQIPGQATSRSGQGATDVAGLPGDGKPACPAAAPGVLETSGGSAVRMATGGSMALPALEEPADGGTGSAAVDAAEAPFAQELLKAAAPGGARVQGQAEPRFLEPTAQPSLQHTVEAAAAAPREGGALHSSTGEGTHGHGIRGREIVSQLAQEVVRHGAAGNGEITIRLRPEELGELRLNIRLENQKLHVDVVAENRGVRDVLLDNVQTLRESLERQNVRMERFDVSYGGSGNGPGQGFGQGGRAEQGRQLLYDSPAGGDLDAHPIPGAGSQADEGESLLVDVRL